MKHFKQIFLAVLVALASSISANAHDFEVNGLYYSFNSDNTTVGVTFKGESPSVTDRYEQTTVRIPASVEYDGKTYAVTSIKEKAFSYSPKLYEVVFQGDLISIENQAFYGCNQLQYANLPLTLESIGKEAFRGCSLRSSGFYLPNSVTYVGDGAFYQSGIGTLYNSTVYANYGGGKDCVVPEGITHIAGMAFFHKSDLQTVSLPSTILSIGNYAFAICSNLKTINFPEGLLSIGDYAFDSAEQLRTVTVPNSVSHIGQRAFVFSGVSSATIPDNLTDIGPSAFYDCRITEPLYNNKVMIAMPLNYSGKFTVPSGITKIVGSAFKYCQNLTELELPNTLVEIGEEAFAVCTKLTSIIIPKSVTKIDDYAFNSCTGLKVLKLLNDNPSSITLDANNIFLSFPITSCLLSVPAGSEKEYANANIWNGFTNINKYDVLDGSDYLIPIDSDNIDVTYSRNFANTFWQSLYLPFSLKYEDWADKADVAYINNVHQWDDDKDGEIDRTMLEFITKKSGAIEANKPYVIRPKQTGDVTFTSEDVTLYAAPETDGFVDCMSTTTKYTLYGTYQEKTDMYKNGYYAMSDGDFMQAENSSVTLAPFRIYMKIESRTGNGAVQNAPKKVKIMVDGIVDDEATGLEGIIAGDEDSSEHYNLAGQKVSSGYKGIVIKNGRKYLMK